MMIVSFSGPNEAFVESTSTGPEVTGEEPPSEVRLLQKQNQFFRNRHRDVTVSALSGV